eukprot:TRINITY_DN7429_c0_g1_i2.p1 TRINITY_DN7429_c0_g1~~TRINITY_DN7429_c0_g1_i2.p1  ORF type:complete len:299 (-),score=11.14 TRINITY_DN7429_c0_g1_i2:22-918(-)
MFTVATTRLGRLRSSLRTIAMAIVQHPDTNSIGLYNTGTEVTTNIILPGDYVLLSTSLPLEIKYPERIFNPPALSSQQSSPYSSPPRKQRSDSSAPSSNPDSPSSSGASSPAITAACHSTFRALILSRDTMCVVTQIPPPSVVEASHIIPLGWLKYSASFPSSVQDFFRTVRNNANCIQNGIILDASLHKAYDRFLWAIYSGNDGSYTFVSLNSVYDRFDGQPIHFGRNQAIPDRAILNYHLQMAIFYHLVPAKPAAPDKIEGQALDGNNDRPYYDDDPCRFIAIGEVRTLASYWLSV